MRTFIFLFFTTAFAFTPNEIVSQNSKIKVEEDKTLTVDEVFKLIMNQTDYKFFYEKGIFNDFPKVQLKKGFIKTNKLLKRTLSNGSLDIVITGNNGVIIKEKQPSSSNEQQKHSVSGTITDTSGQPLPGANILEKGTTNGTQADFDGKFSLSVDSGNAVLVISYLGFVTQEVEVNNQTQIDISLREDIAGLDEVVVVGYGTQKRQEVASAVVQTTGEEILRSSSTAISNSLAGRLPGVIINQRSGEPGRDAASILIRGSSTFGNNAALIVIDGVQERDGLSRLDPNDIETISVLKDASAAIYGSRSSGGVILITTKRGKTGKPQITYNSNVGFASATKLPEYGSSASYAQAINDVFAQRGAPLPFTDQEIDLYRNGSDPIRYPNPDWFDAVFETAVQSRHNLSVRGGNEQVKYFLSLGTAKQGSIAVGPVDGYKQYNFRSNVDAQITDRLQVSLDLSGREENREFSSIGTGTLMTWVSRQSPFQPIRWPNGSYSPGIEGTHPLAALEGSGYDRQKNQIFNGTLSFKYDLPGIDGLRLTGFFAVDKRTDFDKNFATPWSFFDYDPDTDVYTPRTTTQRAIIDLREGFSQNESLTSNIRLEYDQIFNDVHDVSAMLGYEHNEREGDNFNALIRNFDTDIIDQFFAGSSSPDDQFVGGSGFESGRQSLFGRAKYIYNSKYIAQFSFRYDGSINFPTGDRFGFFPSASVAWRITQEDFMENVSFLNELKLRASYGERGNDRISPFQYLSSFGVGGGYVFDGQRVNGIVPSSEPILNVTWERHKTLDIGFEARLFSNKLSLEFDYFKTTTSDILGRPQNTLPSLAGFSPPDQNIGEMENKGVELVASYRDNIGDLQYNVGGNFAFARNKVLFFDEGAVAEEYQKAEGRPLGSFLVLDAIGIYRNQADIDNSPSLAGTEVGDLQYRDVNDDGVINGDDRIRINRNSTPEITFGFNLGLSYKGFDLNTLFQGQANSLQRIFSGNPQITSGNLLQARLDDYYTPSNPDAAFPRLGIQSNFFGSTFWLKDTWFLRLKNLEVGYTLPRDITSKIGVDKVRVYAGGSNLWTIDNIEVFDPELTTNTGAAFPLTKVYNFGINVSL